MIPGPRSLIATAKDEGSDVCRGRRTVDGCLLQQVGDPGVVAVLAAEVDPHRPLQTVVAVGLDATIDLGVHRGLVRVDELDRHLVLDDVGVVEPRRAEDRADRPGDREGGDRREGAGHLRAVGRAVDDVGIHRRVLGHHLDPRRDEFAVRESGNAVALTEHTRDEQVRVARDVGGRSPGGEGRGPQRGGRAHRDGAGVRGACGGGWLRAVGRVADGCAGSGGRERDREGRGVEAAGGADRQRGDLEGVADTVRGARRGGAEVPLVAAGPHAVGHVGGLGRERRVLVDDVARGVVEGERLAVVAQREPGVEPTVGAGGGHAGGEHDELRAGGQRAAREREPGCGSTVHQLPAGQIDRCRAGIGELDPIAGPWWNGRIEQSSGIGGQQLRNNELRSG